MHALLSFALTDGVDRATHADLRLDAGRPGEVAALVAGHEEDDALLLRLAIAEAQSAAPGSSPPAQASAAEARHGPAAAAMAARFRASRERGDVVHRREEARFLLAVEHDPVRALALAVANWDVQ